MSATEAGTLRPAMVLVIAVVLILACLVWWFSQRSSSVRLHPLELTSHDRLGFEASDGKSPARRSEAFPGRRRLYGPVARRDETAIDLGSEQPIGDGHRVRVIEYEATLRASVEGAAGDLVVDTARVEACAGESGWNGGALAAAYHLAYPRPSGGLDLRPAASGVVVREPALSTSLAGEALAPGDCHEGWVAFVLGTPEDFDDRLPAAIVFDNTAFGFVSDGGTGRVVWRVP